MRFGRGDYDWELRRSLAMIRDLCFGRDSSEALRTTVSLFTMERVFPSDLDLQRPVDVGEGEAEGLTALGPEELITFDGLGA